jgi:Tfp pilus assembly protein PilF
MGDDRPRVRAEGSGSVPSVAADGEELRARSAAEEMTAKQDWGMARAMWHQLACASPPNKYYRAQLMYARAGELMIGGHADKAKEELERVLRLDPEHAGATAMLNGMKKRGGRLSRWLLNR